CCKRSTSQGGRHRTRTAQKDNRGYSVTISAYQCQSDPTWGHQLIFKRAPVRRAPYAMRRLGFVYPGLRSWWIVANVVFIITLVLGYLSWTFVESSALARKKAVSHWINNQF